MKSQTQRNAATNLSPSTTDEQLLVDGGSAVKRLHAVSAPRAAAAPAEPLDVIVIGAGQAGLSVGYHLQRRGLRFVILNADARVGDTWRNRWDSLRLFSPARLDSLDGLPFPAARDYFPTKDEMADYLESYVAHFSLPVRNGVRVERVSKREDGRYVVKAGALELEAPHVVVAMASYQKPKVPEFGRELPADVLQLHSKDYRNPSQLNPGPVLLVGAGNSGSEIAKELSRSHKVYMAGRDTGEVPFRIGSWLGANVLEPMLMRIVFHRILTMSTPVGRKARPHIVSKGGPLIRVHKKELDALGVERTGRVAGVKDGKPVLEDGRALDVANVIWCTGFDPSSSFVDLPVFGEDGCPKHERGVVEGESGLYFTGLAFLYSMSSTMIHGTGRDAEHVAKAIAKREATKATQQR